MTSTSAIASLFKTCRMLFTANSMFFRGEGHCDKDSEEDCDKYSDKDSDED